MEQVFDCDTDEIFYVELKYWIVYTYHLGDKVALNRLGHVFQQLSSHTRSWKWQGTP